MSSSERPLVSGTAKYVHTPDRNENTAKKANAPYGECWTSAGVMRPMMLYLLDTVIVRKYTGAYKLLNQLEQVDKATPFARIVELNISVGIAQGTGPHDSPNATM